VAAEPDAAGGRKLGRVLLIPRRSHSRRHHLATRAPAGLRMAHGRRLVPSAVARRSAVAGLAVLMLAGCAKFDAALSQRWVNVTFKPGTPAAQVLHIRAACSHIPNVSAKPIPRNAPASEVASLVSYDITNASDANTAELEGCLAKFPAAVGVDPEDAGGSGG
jgi:hypothetical protein